MREICAVQLVHVLDNVQWADLNSTELVQQILASKESNNLLLKAIYRVDKVDQSD